MQHKKINSGTKVTNTQVKSNFYVSTQKEVGLWSIQTMITIQRTRYTEIILTQTRLQQKPETAHINRRGQDTRERQNRWLGWDSLSKTVQPAESSSGVISHRCEKSVQLKQISNQGTRSRRRSWWMRRTEREKDRMWMEGENGKKRSGPRHHKRISKDCSIFSVL